MKNWYGILISALLCLSACERPEILAPEENGMVFTARIVSEDTRTAIDGLSVKWEDGDEISINGVLFTATPDSGNPSNAVFRKKNTEDPDPQPVGGKYSAYYPAGIYEDGKVVLPSVQKFKGGQLVSAPMFAESENTTLSFSNLCALVEMNVKGSATVTGIEISSSGNLSGECSIDGGNKAVPVGTDSETDRITLDCGSGVALSKDGVKFYVAVPAGEYEDFSVRINASVSGKNKVFNTSASNLSVERNKLYHLQLEPSFTDYFITVRGLSDAVSVNGSTARVYLDIQSTEGEVSSAILSSADANGKTNEYVQISSRGFDEEKGLHYVDLSFNDSETDEADVYIKARINFLYTCTSNKIHLSKFRMNAFGVDATWDGSRFYLISWLEDLSSVPVQFTAGDAEVLAGGMEPDENGIVLLDLNETKQISVSFNGDEYSFPLEAVYTGLPVVLVTTPGGAEVTSKEDWMEGASIKIHDGDAVDLDIKGGMSIKGRGNSSWKYPKKPYALKFKDKSKVLGMPKNKRWALLANWADRTLLRNDAAFWLSNQTSGLKYTPRGKFVELVLNGHHQGNYYLVEQVKVGKDRVNITEIEDPSTTDPSLISGGYLLEIDSYWDEAYKFRSATFNMPYQLKEPDENVSDGALAWIENYVNEMEVLIKGTDGKPDPGYREYLDIDSAIDYMLVNEMATNCDYFHVGTEEPHSCFLYKDRGGKLFYGPVWDFDFHGFDSRAKYANDWQGADNENYYFYYLANDSVFKARMLEKWNEEKENFAGLSEYIDTMADYIRKSEALNSKMWPIVNGGMSNGDESMSFQDAVDRIKLGFTTKFTWMDKNLRKL